MMRTVGMPQPWPSLSGADEGMEMQHQNLHMLQTDQMGLA